MLPVLPLGLIPGLTLGICWKVLYTGTQTWPNIAYEPTTGLTPGNNPWDNHRDMLGKYTNTDYDEFVGPGCSKAGYHYPHFEQPGPVVQCTHNLSS